MHCQDWRCSKLCMLGDAGRPGFWRLLLGTRIRKLQCFIWANINPFQIKQQETPSSFVLRESGGPLVSLGRMSLRHCTKITMSWTGATAVYAPSKSRWQYEMTLRTSSSSKLQFKLPTAVGEICSWVVGLCFYTSWSWRKHAYLPEMNEFHVFMDVYLE